MTSPKLVIRANFAQRNCHLFDPAVSHRLATLRAMPIVRSIFLSDIHLGTRACQADQLVDFLRDTVAENLFLLGDIVDFWAMRRRIVWTEAQNTFVQKILRRARRGERVVFIPGNHDEALRDYLGIAFGDIEVLGEHVHTLADGRRFLLLHGDEFDQITRHHRWVALLGDATYNGLVRLNALISFGKSVIDLGPVGAGIFGLINRLLIPVGLHHAFYPVFWFDVAGINDIPNFLGGAKSLAEGKAVLGVTGIYQAGFFPIMMFGLPGAALAIYHASKSAHKARVASIMLAAAMKLRAGTQSERTPDSAVPKTRTKAARAAALGAMDMKAVMGVGAPS